MNHKAILCIGIDAFDKGDITPLAGAAQDARRWAAFFEHQLGFLARALTHEDIRAGARVFDAVDELLAHAGQPDDVFGVFIATHGKQMALPLGGHDQLFLLPHARLASIEAGHPGDGALSMRQLALETARPGLQRFFIIDACRAPLTAAQAGRDASADFGAQGQVVYRDIGLRRAPQGQADSPLLIFNACADQQRAGELRDQRRGLFSLAAEEVAAQRLKSGARLALDAEFAATVGARMRQLAPSVQAQDPVIDQGEVLCLWDPADRRAQQWQALRAEFEQQLAEDELDSPPGDCARDTLATLRVAGLPQAEHRDLAERLAQAQSARSAANRAAQRAEVEARLLAAAEKFDSEAAWLALWTGAQDDRLCQRAQQRLSELRQSNAPPPAPPAPAPDTWLPRADTAFRALGDTPDEVACQAFIDQFPRDVRLDEVHRLQARAQQRSAQQRALEALGPEPDWVACDRFLNTWPHGPHTSVVQAMQQAARDRLAWKVAQRQPTRESLAAYLAEFPNGQWSQEARRQQQQIQQAHEGAARQRYDALGRSPGVAECDQFLQSFADTEMAAKVQHLRQRAHDLLAWQVAERINTVDSFRAYQDEYPKGAYAEAAEQALHRLVAAAESLRSSQYADETFAALRLKPEAAACQAWLESHPGDSRAEEVAKWLAAARQRDTEQRAFDALGSKPEVEECDRFVAQYPKSVMVPHAKRLREQARDRRAWATADSFGTRQSYSLYLAEFPYGAHSERAQLKLTALRPSEVDVPSPDTVATATLATSQDLQAPLQKGSAGRDARTHGQVAESAAWMWAWERLHKEFPAEAACVLRIASELQLTPDELLAEPQHHRMPIHRGLLIPIPIIVIGLLLGFGLSSATLLAALAVTGILLPLGLMLHLSDGGVLVDDRGIHCRGEQPVAWVGLKEVRIGDRWLIVHEGGRLSLPVQRARVKLGDRAQLAVGSYGHEPKALLLGKILFHRPDVVVR